MWHSEWSDRAPVRGGSGGRVRWALAGCGLVATLVRPVAAQVEPALADSYFEEVRVLCEHEGGRLWGVPLCGPLVFADAATSTIATNRPAPAGDRPPTLGYANSYVVWGGTRWAALVWPPPRDDARSRGALMLHELFHRIQPELGLTFPEPKNDHLDTAEGRYWLQLEWRALRKAIGTSGPARETALADALAFRRARRARFPEAAENERILELQEGLAQYTGVVASTATARQADSVAMAQLDTREWLTSLVRTFAYGSGTAYGVLLDEYSPGWTRRLGPRDDLGTLLAEASGVSGSPDPATAAAAYGGPSLLVAERAREAEREARVAELRARFVDGPVLVLPGTGTYSFTSQGITPLGEHGSVYPTVRATADWGTLEGALVLVDPEGGSLTVPAPPESRGDTIHGDDWTLVLAPGWKLGPGPRPGDLAAARGDEGHPPARVRPRMRR